jgi:peptidoglycan/LPS O-acetylase OafA/YrhL
MKRPVAPGYIPTLDGWRAVAILGVIACHASGYFFSSYGLYPNPRIYAYLFHGARGVSIFFCLSGFLICTLLLKEYDAAGSINIRGFYIRRAFRILPPYWSYLLTIGALALMGVLVVPRNDILACLLFVRNYIPGGDWYTVHFWTLALEEHFYLLLPALLLFAKGRKSLAVILSLTILSTAIRYYVATTPPVAGLIKWDGDAPMNELLTGALGAVLITFQSIRRWIGGMPWWLWLLLASTIVYSEVRPLRPLLLGVLQPVIFTLLIIATVLRPTTLVGKVLESAPLRHIGVISYGLYIWQELFLAEGPASQSPLGIFQRWPVSWLMVAIVPILSFVFLEKPLIGVGRRLSKRISVKSSGALPATASE